MKSLKPQTITKKEKKRKRKRNILRSIFLGILFFLFIWMMHLEKFKFSQIEIKGNQMVSSIAIEKLIREYTSKNFLWVFPRENIFFLNTHKIQQDIENSFPIIYHVEVKIKKGTLLEVVIEERKPHSLWCKMQDLKAKFNEECYFADQRGYLYTKAPYFSSGIFEKIYTTENFLKIGSQLMDKKDFSTFFRFIHSLTKNFKLEVNKIFIGEFHEVRIYMDSLFMETFYLHKPYFIFKNDMSYEVIGRNFQLLSENLLFQREFKKHPERLKFIDLRIPDQIRFKFYSDEEWNALLKKQEEQAQEENKTNEG